MHRRDFLRSLLAAPFCTACVDLVSPKAQALPRPAVLSAGPWKGVYDTADPFDAGPDRLRDLQNGYIPDADAGSGAFARPGFALSNAGVALNTTTGSPGNGSAAPWDGITILDLASVTECHFTIANGKLYRLANGPVETTCNAIDVTPAGITISASGNVFMLEMFGKLIVTDETNRPWIGTNLTSTPITGAYIDYDGAATAWKATRPTLYLGSLFFPLIEVGGVSRAGDISWSSAGDPATGYQQTNFDYNWTLVQGKGQITGVVGTNLALYYFREQSIGTIAGTDITNLASSATTDTVAYDVGTKSPGSLCLFGNTIFFCDANGRPYRLVPGQAPTPLWHQMRFRADTYGRVKFPGAVSAVIDPVRQLYLAAIWKETENTVVTDLGTPRAIYAFDANTGSYQGRWTVNDSGTGGVDVGRLITLRSQSTGLDTIGFIGRAVPGAYTDVVSWHFLWMVRDDPWPIVDANKWLDGNSAGTLIQPQVKATTDRMGEAEGIVYAVDRIAAITGNATPCSVTVETTTTSGTAIGSPTPDTSTDGTYRIVAGMDGIQGRGPSAVIAPTFSSSNAGTLGQWSLHRVSITASPSNAGPEEP